MARSGTSAWGFYFANPTEVLVVLSWGDIGFQESDSQDAGFRGRCRLAQYCGAGKRPIPPLVWD